MNEYKQCLLNILLWFHNFCIKNDLRYYLVEGTMLGAARHQGFIPWDDDIDVGMPRKDYEKLQNLMGENIHGGKYLLETEKSGREEYFYPFSKIYDITTTLIEQRRVPVKMGVYIDVFPLDGIGETEDEARNNYKKIGFLQNVLAARSVAQRKGRKWYKNFAAWLFQLIPNSVINEKKMLSNITELCKKRPFDESTIVGNLVSTYRSKEIMPRMYYGKPTLYTFEGHAIYGVEKPDMYLSRLYGDWRTPPDMSNRESTHEKIELDLNKSYLE